MGEVYLVAIICNPQAAAMTENFSQQVSGRAVSNMQCDLQARWPKWNIGGSQFGCISNLDPGWFGIWPTLLPSTPPPICIVGRIFQIQPTHTYDSRSHKLESVLKCEWNGHFHHVGIWLLVQLTRWCCSHFTLTSNDHCSIALHHYWREHPVRFC